MKALIIIFLTLGVFGGAAFVGYKMFVQPQIALKNEKFAPPTPTPPDPTLPEFNKCIALRKVGKMVPAREAFAAFVEHYPQSSKIEDAKNMLGDINTDIFLSTIAAPEKEVYIVKKGDVIDRVARSLKTTDEIIMKANNLQRTMLMIGQKLTVAPGGFSLVISHKENKVIVLNKGKFFKQYAILSWPASQAPKPGAKPTPIVKIAGKVTDKIAWFEGTRVTIFEKGYASSMHWIQINIKGCTLHSVADEKSPQMPPGGGIRLTPDALDELSAILSKGDPVTLE